MQAAMSADFFKSIFIRKFTGYLSHLMSNVKIFIFESQNLFWNLSHLGQENTSIFF